MAAMGAVYFLYGLRPFLFAYDHWIGLCTASLAMSILQVSPNNQSAYRTDRSDWTENYSSVLQGIVLLRYVIHSWYNAICWRKYWKYPIRCMLRSSLL